MTTTTAYCEQEERWLEGVREHLGRFFLPIHEEDSHRKFIRRRRLYAGAMRLAYRSAINAGQTRAAARDDADRAQQAMRACLCGESSV